MYVSHDASKNANLSLVKAYAAAGIKSFLFFEDTANRATGGYAAGQTDAAFAYQTAASYGLPKWAPIAPAVDFDMPDYAPNSSDPMAKLGPVGQYMKAWHDYNQAHGIKDSAAYGDFYLMKRLAAARLMTIGIQTVAWSGGQIDLADIALYQNAAMVFGGTADIEIIESSALLTRLAWVPGEADPNPAVTPPVPAPPVSTAFHGEYITGGMFSLMDVAKKLGQPVNALLRMTVGHYGTFGDALGGYLADVLTGKKPPTTVVPKGVKLWVD